MKLNKKTTKRTILAATGMAAILAAPAYAQDSVQDGTSDTEQTDGGLDVIVVTAQKRSENLQDVPISITAVTGDKMEQAGLDNLSDLSSYVPGLTISKGAVNTNIYIRGVGSGINRAFEQSVGMYVDGIYMGRGRQYRSPFLDVERVEVLRGPQGILFGKNAVAGAVNVISRSAEPGDVLSGSLAVTYEPEHDTKEVIGVLSSGIGGQLGVRVAGKYRKTDGYLDNTLLGTKEPAVDEVSVRGSLQWVPTSDLSFNLKASYSDYKVDGTSAIARVFKLTDDPAVALDTVGFAAVGLADPNFMGGREIFSVSRNREGPGESISPAFNDFGLFPEQNDTESLNLVFTANWQTDIGTLTAVTGWSEYDTEDGADVDFLPIQLIHRDDFHEFDQFSQEIRFVSDLDGPFNFIVGGYYDKQNFEARGGVLIDGTIRGLTTLLTGGTAQTLLGPASGLPFSYNVISRQGAFIQDSESFALFGQVTFEVTDYLRLIAGGRYSHDKKTADKTLIVASDITGGVFNAANPDDGTAGTVLTAAWRSLFGTIPHTVTDSRKESHFDPSLKIEWDAFDDVMFYASYTEGYKSGGFNATDDLPFNGTTGLFFPMGSPTFGLFNAGTPVGFEYQDETVKSYEIGVKSEFGGRFRLNISGFLTKYSDLQVASFQGTNFVVGNAANSEIKGIEAEAEVAVSDHFRVGGSLAYLDFDYVDFADAGCTAIQAATINQAFNPANPGAPLSAGLCSTGPVVTLASNGFPNIAQNLAGQTSEYSPELSGSLFAAFTHEVGDNFKFSANADVNWSTKYFLDSDLDPASEQGGFAKVNVRVAFGAEDDSWELAVFGRNITEEKVFGASNDTPLITGSHTAHITEPAVWGVSGKVRF